VVSEGGVPVEKSTGLRLSGREGNFLVCDATAGTYNFNSTF
jgi:hypothetical protein